jgi:hypothetical protein
MTKRATFLSLVFLAGCATAGPGPAPEAGPAAARGPAARPVETPSAAASAGPSDWAVAIVGTPFVFAFRTVVCAATAVVAGPTAGLLAFSEERDEGLAYLRYGLAENCGGPYVVPVPVAGRYDPDPYVARPRPLTSDDEDPLTMPRRLAEAAAYTAED